jgi:tetratricopeptide (TPR) repeat protein
MGSEELPSLNDEEFQQLYDKARMALHLGQPTEALEIAQRMVAARGESTTAQEVLGDAYAALDRLGEAEQAYRRAAELEPANADALRKLGEVVLRIKNAELQVRFVEERLQAKALRGVHDPDPEGAAARSALFPGLGQLYNGDYEKGVAFGTLGLVCIAFLSHGLLELLSTGESHPYASLFAVFGGTVGLAVYIYSIWDAARGAKSHRELTQLYRDSSRERK